MKQSLRALAACVIAFGGWATVPSAADASGQIAAVDGSSTGRVSDGVVGRSAAADIGASGTQAVSCTLGATNHCTGLTQIEFSGDGVTEPVNLGGLDGRRTVPVVPGDLNMYFGVSDAVAYDGTFSATFTAAYYDGGTTTFQVQYDSACSTCGSVSGAYTLAGSVTETGTNTWKTASFTVDNAKFAGRENGGADFRVVSGQPVAIHSMTVDISGSGVRPPGTITVDGSSTGRVFDGVGGLSAGASSRLLYDYPPDQRAQVLDYLFKPDYGASLQILKVEIGGDSNSTDGAEPSHESTRGAVDCDRGYEWWLMEQAQARNPNIQFYGLEWAAPGWFRADPGKPSTPYYRFWSQDNIDYLVSWLGCAQQHGLHVNYIGGWNEDGHDKTWYEALHAAFAADHIDTKIVAADTNGGQRWDVTTDMSEDPAFAAAVDVVGVHDPCGGSPLFARCPDTAAARSLSKPVWDSETSSLTHDTGAPAIARTLNRDYIDGRMTAHIYWSLVSAWYSDLPIADTGLMLAETPWSGYYDVGDTIWTMAHTTQFTEPGWRYLDNSSGYLDGGSYVTMRSPSSGDYSTIVETTQAAAPQTVQFNVTGGLSTETVHMWSTDLSTPNSSAAFVHDTDLRPSGGAFTATLLPDHVYTFSTTTGQHKGSAAPPASASDQLTVPYRDTFEQYSAGSLAHYFSDLYGSFTAARCTDGRAGTCYQQTTPQQSIPWFAGVISPTTADRTTMTPTTLVGDPRWWGNYQVSVDANFASANFVELLGRVDSWRGSTVSGYHLRLQSDGTFTLYTQDVVSGAAATLASGAAALEPGAWHNLRLVLTGNDIQAIVDGAVVADVQDQHHTSGQVGLSVGSWQPAQFDNLSVTPDGPSPHFLPHAGVAATATSEQPTDGRYNYLASNAIDDRPETRWNAGTGGPQSITVDLGTVSRVAAMTYQPRLDGSAAGMISDYTISTSVDGKAFTTAAHGSWPTTTATKVAPFDQAVAARYVRLTADAVTGCPGSAGGGELGFSSTPITDMQTVGSAPAPPPPFDQFVPQSQMTATATSQYSSDYTPPMAIDGNCATFWHSAPAATHPLPASITLSLGGQYNTTGLTYLPRQVGGSNGWIQDYAVYVSTDGASFTQVAQGTWPTDGTTKYAAWPRTSARYVRLEALSGYAGVASAAELDIACDS